MAGKRRVFEPQIRARFHTKYRVEGGCWIWAARKNACGYGLFTMGHAKQYLAHRVAYSLFRGPVPDDMNVCHTCDTPACVKPDHLFLGTQAENVADMVVKRRHVPPPPRAGARNPQAKLTREQVDELIEARRRGVKLREIAARYGVSEATVSMIASGKRWGLEVTCPSKDEGRSRVVPVVPLRGGAATEGEGRLEV